MSSVICYNRGRGKQSFEYAVSKQSKEAPGWTDDAWISSLSAGWIIMEAGSRSFVPAAASYGTKASCGVVPVHSTPRTHLVLEKDTGRP